MLTFDLQPKLLAHGVMACPGCETPVHVVSNPFTASSRWCCLACRTVGSAPLELYGNVPPQLHIEPEPVASA